METSYSEIKKKDVINLKDGKKLGRVTDITFTYPDGKILGFVVPGSKGFCFFKREIFIDLRHVVKIGEDTVFVDACPVPDPGKRREPDKCPPPPKRNVSYEDYE